MSQFSISLVWFRNDLRLLDNETFYKATVSSQYVIPFFCFDEHLFETSHYGFPRIRHHRAKFLYESVENINNQITAVNSMLLVAKGNPIIEIEKLIHNYAIDAIFYSKEHCWEEKQREVELDTMLLKFPKVQSVSFWNSSLLQTSDLPFSLDSLPKNFTQYFNKVKEILPYTLIKSVPKPISKPLPQLLQSQRFEMEFPKIRDIFPLLQFEESEENPFFEGGEQRGKERVKEYIWTTNSVSIYKETRNGLLGKNYSSKFSPWLSVGSISTRFVYEEILRYEEEREANESTYWLGYELFWRDYFQLVAQKYGKNIFLPKGLKGFGQKKEYSPEFAQHWIQGTTGIPFIDAAMKEISQTGYMSNRMRQNVASYLIHELNIPWLFGAEYFESHLIDYDPSSNYGNWNYLAGVGCDPREIRKFSILKQAKTYDPYGEFVRHWIPELLDLDDSVIHTPWLSKKTCSYPKPIVQLKENSK